MAGVSVYCGCREGGVGYIGGGIQRQQGEGVQGVGGGQGEGRVNIQPNVYRYTDSTAPPSHKKPVYLGYILG